MTIEIKTNFISLFDKNKVEKLETMAEFVQELNRIYDLMLKCEKIKGEYWKIIYGGIPAKKQNGLMKKIDQQEKLRAKYEKWYFEVEDIAKNKGIYI